jgi:hypothetical protein
MDWAGIVLAAAITTGDYATTQGALARGGIEASPLKQQQVRAAVQFSVLVATDIVIQKQAPKLKWYWRGVVAVGMGYVMYHNHHVMRRDR